ncbi:hypothetical protein NQ318_015666 [Aromia moschata]|uniref:THAP-type domain-containing protein n=1 Tax=Aromia moschata TaxID=1265417 RepID=A0AAV8XRI5_9CUCU|nr:hypothetical protein NQ318_015666 [Aromia moschata]
MGGPTPQTDSVPLNHSSCGPVPLDSFHGSDLITFCYVLDITEVYWLFAKIGEVKLKNIAYYRLAAKRYESWMQAIGRDPKENLSITHNAICSDHFTQDSHIYVDDKRKWGLLYKKVVLI